MKRFEREWQEFKWIDIEEPSPQDLEKLAEEFSLPVASVTTCLDPEHLPRAEFFENALFIILRHHDPAQKSNAATMQELSTKLIFFVGEKFLLTIHRPPLPCTTFVKDEKVLSKFSLIGLVKYLAIQSIRSFEPSLDDLDTKTDVIEGRVFALRRQSILREGYTVKRKASSYRKIFKFTNDIFVKIPTEIDVSLRDLSHVREPLEKLIFYADGIHEEITGLLNLHLSLMSQKTNEASFRTNEVMRVLTVFSIFFLPLNFIAGVYGMNFENMPELKTEHGYYIVLGLMAAVVLAITYWIYRRGWLKQDSL